MYCRTKSGTLRLVHNSEEILLDAVGQELPDDLAESIRNHVNVEIGRPPPEKPAPTKAPAAFTPPAPPAQPKPAPARRNPRGDEGNEE